MKKFAAPADLAAAVGAEIGHSDWLTVDQQRIDRFADSTGDHQWIHTDTERAAAGPFGATIAHGYLTLSLLPVLVDQVYRVEGVRMAVNYGLNKVRFIHPVRVGSKLRARVTVLAAEEVTGGWQITSRITLELNGMDKPACVAEAVARLYP
ncbi:MaoC family dehydratase [Kitasatospora sp. YST-16]|uniref:MaoC family dehydratase n=1 Tax=Kitasatospora sp. YST-16 TaxID=2998080 RepID=UPI0022848DE9|nr:MaoC family dehydratase [Kitasatospora sp. YST-16]WAL74646.1 MaoC family dehydratase [Kitasatospora sp. YST-16]WNW40704.1 MaoC family dehydratase [Streptomyces sp. Li-HN-5-13]